MGSTPIQGITKNKLKVSACFFYTSIILAEYIAKKDKNPTTAPAKTSDGQCTPHNILEKTIKQVAAKKNAPKGML